MSSIVNDNDNNDNDNVNNNVIFNFSNGNIRETKTFYEPPQSTNSQDVRNIPKLKHRIKKTLAIGDSFIGIFKLLKPESNVRIEKIKGGTAKGIFIICS